MVPKIEIFGGKVICPQCNDGSGGFIYKTELSPIQKTVYICDECDALWEQFDQIMKGFAISLSAYAKTYGYTYDEVQLNNIDYYWYKP